MVWSVCYDPVAAAVRHVWADDGDNDNARRGHGTDTELWAVPVQKRIATTSGVGARGALGGPVTRTLRRWSGSRRRA